MTVFMHLKQIGAPVADFIAFGLFVPTYPYLEAIQEFVRVMATNIENLHIYRTDMAFRPIDDKPRTAGPAGGRYDHHHQKDNYGTTNPFFHFTPLR